MCLLHVLYTKIYGINWKVVKKFSSVDHIANLILVKFTPTCIFPKQYAQKIV